MFTSECAAQCLKNLRHVVPVGARTRTCPPCWTPIGPRLWALCQGSGSRAFASGSISSLPGGGSGRTLKGIEGVYWIKLGRPPYLALLPPRSEEVSLRRADELNTPPPAALTARWHFHRLVLQKVNLPLQSHGLIWSSILFVSPELG